MTSNQSSKNIEAGDGVLSRIQKVWKARPLHEAKLKGPTPDRIYFQPSYPLTPDRDIGLDIMRGRMNFGGAHSGKPNADSDAIGFQGADIKQTSRFWQNLSNERTPNNEMLFRFAHEFSWLHHMAALNGENLTRDLTEEELTSPKQVTHNLLSGWLDHFEQWSAESWTPDLVAERLMHMCSQCDFLLKSGDALWRSRVLNSMARQTRHLAHIAHKAAPGTSMLMTAMSLCLAGLCIPSCEVAIERGQELMRRELRLQVRSDGGHVSRNPSLQLELVVRLHMIVSAYEARKLPLPGYLRLALSRAAVMVQFFRCPDGRLTIFNGGYEADPRMLIAAGQVVEQDTMPIGFARYSFYQRMNAARGLVIADVGGKTEQTQTGFDSAGSFHFSSGRVRIVGNCGNGDHLGGDWAKALRQASAHSSFSLQGPERSRSSLYNGKTLYQRDEGMSGILLEIRRAFALEHQQSAPAKSFNSAAEMGGKTQFMGDIPQGWAGHSRRLYLTAGGDDFRGEDRVMGLPSIYGLDWRIRFHLHPEIKTSLARDGRSVILILPNQEGWRFRTNYKGVRLEKSVYCGAGGRPVTAEHIVIGPADGNGELDNEAGKADQENETRPPYVEGVGDEPHNILVKWAFKRLDGV